MITISSKLLKIRYRDARSKLMGYRNNPLLGMLKKREDFTGASYNFGIWYQPGAGRSAVFANAQDNTVADAEAQFVLTRTTNYGIHKISAEALKASVGREAAFVEGRTQLMDSVIYKLTQDISNDLYRDGSGTRGRIGALGTDLITLSNRSDIVNFERGMRIRLVDGAGAPTAAPRTGVGVITGVNRNAGTISLELDDLTGEAVNDYIIAEGDTAGGGAVVKLSGLDAWVPSSEPTSTSFFGVDRSTDTQRLGGIRYDGSSQSVEEAILDAGVLAYEAGAKPDVLLMNPVHFAELEKSLQQKAIYDPSSSLRSQAVEGARVYYPTITVVTGAGPVKATMDPNCPRGVAWMLQMDTWELVSLGAVPHLADEDGLTITRAAAADTYEVRFRAWPQLACHFPGWNTRITLATS